MNTQVAYKVITPCGFEVWIIPLPDIGTVRLRARFQENEVGMDYLSEKISFTGLRMVADKIREVIPHA